MEFQMAAFQFLAGGMGGLVRAIVGIIAPITPRAVATDLKLQFGIGKPQPVAAPRP